MHSLSQSELSAQLLAKRLLRASANDVELKRIRLTLLQSACSLQEQIDPLHRYEPANEADPNTLRSSRQDSCRHGCCSKGMRINTALDDLDWLSGKISGQLFSQLRRYSN